MQMNTIPISKPNLFSADKSHLVNFIWILIEEMQTSFYGTVGGVKGEWMDLRKTDFFQRDADEIWDL